MALVIRELQQNDGCNALSLGDAAYLPLKNFLRREAKKLHLENLARTFVMVEEDDAKVRGYITTVCSNVSVEQFSGNDVPLVEGFRYKDYPAIKLARLAVDRSLRGVGAGSRLVDLAIGLILQHVMPHFGCRFLIVDAKASSIGFYLKKGFTPIGVSADDDQQTAMFIDLQRLPRD